MSLFIFPLFFYKYLKTSARPAAKYGYRLAQGKYTNAVSNVVHFT
jgi:hypothetical protein